MQIKIPATLDSFGPGQQSLAVALDLAITIDVVAPRDSWLVEHNLGAKMTGDATNFLVGIATKLAPKIVAHHIRIRVDAPFEFGVHAALILGGIELANQLGGLQLDDYTKLTLAARTAGQPANVTAALLGGVTTSYLSAGDVYASGVVTPEYKVVIYTPVEALSEVSNEPIPREAAVDYAAAGNMLMAAWQTQQVSLAGRLLEQTLPANDNHRELELMRQTTAAMDIYGTVQTNGAIAVFVEQDRVTDLLDVLRYVEELQGTVEVLDLDKHGLQVID
jgi:homoserine kinase